MNKKRNPMAQELRTPKYRKRVVEDKRKKQIDDNNYWRGEQDEPSRFKKKKA
jgi:hypothetical protein|tara:strand:+ start:504 stop:659 length:156 start_codon:yes stop_codon:yes gene_type:complete